MIWVSLESIFWVLSHGYDGIVSCFQMIPILHISTKGNCWLPPGDPITCTMWKYLKFGSKWYPYHRLPKKAMGYNAIITCEDVTSISYITKTGNITFLGSNKYKHLQHLQKMVLGPVGNWTCLMLEHPQTHDRYQVEPKKGGERWGRSEGKTQENSTGVSGHCIDSLYTTRCGYAYLRELSYW